MPPLTRLSSRRGATLPMVMLFTAILTVALTAAYTIGGSEIQVGDNEQEQLEAFVLAEAGRQRFIGDRASLGLPSAPLAATESVRIPFTNGYADVTMRRIRPGTGSLPAIFLLESHGVRTRTLRAGIPAAERSVAQYVYWQPAPMNVLAGWTSLSGLNKNGGSGSLSGMDASPGPPSCPAPVAAIAGVAVPSTPGFTGPMGPISGNPPVRNLGTLAAAHAAVDVNWPAITNGTSGIVPDITFPGGDWPSFANANYWPIIKVNGDFALPSDGRGTLIVTGSLAISGNKTWTGVILVGMNLLSNGNNTVSGATITGLNTMLGQVVPQGETGNGDKTFQYNSCAVGNALNRTSALTPYQNAWMDNWAPY